MNSSIDQFERAVPAMRTNDYGPALQIRYELDDESGYEPYVGVGSKYAEQSLKDAVR